MSHPNDAFLQLLRLQRGDAAAHNGSSMASPADEGGGGVDEGGDDTNVGCDTVKQEPRTVAGDLSQKAADSHDLFASSRPAKSITASLASLDKRPAHCGPDQPRIPM